MTYALTYLAVAAFCSVIIFPFARVYFIENFEWEGGKTPVALQSISSRHYVMLGILWPVTMVAGFIGMVRVRQ